MARNRHRALDIVTVGLQIGHGLVALAAVTDGVVVLLALSPAHMRFAMTPTGRWLSPGVLAIVALHIPLMLATPVWAWLAARTQTQVSRLWAWLGYLIPVASYWLPARTLTEMAAGAVTDAEPLRRLILAWGVSRTLATPEIMLAVVYGLYCVDRLGHVTAYIALAYMFISVIAANLLSLIVIGQMRRHLATHTIDERRAEVFT